MNIKTLTLAVASTILLSTGAFAQSALDNYNARYVNSPAVKAQMLKGVCAKGDGAALALCDRWTKTGVPDGDVRLGLVAGGAVLGGAAGLVAATVPFAALGGNTVVSQWGITSIAGWAPTAAVVGATGAAAGAVLGGTSYLVR